MSSSDIAIRVEGLGKQYRLGLEQAGTAYRYKSLRDSLGTLAKRPWQAVKSAIVREPMDETNSFWALKDVSFDVKKGEVVGIIGRNGAGKSTLLKILSRITKPTTGQVDLFGRVGSLLEVGTGFHPELSGRENIYLNGAILGMTRAEVKAKFDEIVAFSEIEKFLDTPVKHYSSGMYMRLAFAVAAHLEPDILVVDEVLAVGDVAFQEKCLSKVGNVARNGCTILLVSHNMGVIRASCKTAVMLQEGRIHFSGVLEAAVAAYNNFAAPPANGGFWHNPEINPQDEASIERIEVIDIDGNVLGKVLSSTSFNIRIRFEVRVPSPLLKIGFDLVRSGITVFRTAHVDSPQACGGFPVGKHYLKCEIPAGLLFTGTYHVRPQMSLHFVKWLQPPGEAELRFDVEFDHRNSPFLNILDENNHPGVIFPQLTWTSDRDCAIEGNA